MHFSDSFRNKKILITGHTGFKGSWLSLWLHLLGAEVIGYALDPLTERDNFVLCGLSDRMIDIRGDIRDEEALGQVFETYQPDMVFHLAAQSLVRTSYENPKETYDVNLMGSLNVLECIRKLEQPCIGIMVTTDKCYENKEQIWGYRETDPMGGYDPYSSSKGCMELMISSYRNSFFNTASYVEHRKAIASVRAGNVIGGGDWAKDRIVPDCIRAIEGGKAIEIRNPRAIRPWQHVLEPLRGYLMLGEKMVQDPIRYSGGWNFGPDPGAVVSVEEIVKRVVKSYGRGEYKDISDALQPHEANLLLLDISKARFELGWKPEWNISETVELTVDWYKNASEGSAYQICVEQIDRMSGADISALK